MNDYPPNRFALFGIHPEVFIAQLHRRNTYNLQIGPTLYKFDNSFECVQSKTVIPVVWHMSHKYVNLWIKMADKRDLVKTWYNKKEKKKYLQTRATYSIKNNSLE